MTYFEEILISTKGNCDIKNITDETFAVINKSGVKNGIVTVFAVGSTAGITTVEYEPGLLIDLPKFWDKIIPAVGGYKHNDTWGDGNGHSHLRSALIKTSLTIPIVNSEMILGTWQQIVFLDFDNRPRTRRIAILVMGDK